MINKIFNKIDFVLNKIEEIAIFYNTKKDIFQCANITECCPLEECEPCEEERMLWKYKNPNRNGHIFIFLFRTENKYRSGISEKEIREKSELRKCFYKDNNIEIGLTIEENLFPPTENIWGWTFRGFKYYIIKNNEITITESRSEIRKIYNDKDLSETYNIRISDFNEETKSFEISNVIELDTINYYSYLEKIYLIEIDYDEYYAAHNEDILRKYAYKLIDQDIELKISIVGGLEEAAKKFVEGEQFSLESYLDIDKLSNIIDVEDIDYNEQLNKKIIKNISYPYKELEGYHLFKKE